MLEVLEPHRLDEVIGLRGDHQAAGNDGELGAVARVDSDSSRSLRRTPVRCADEARGRPALLAAVRAEPDVAYLTGSAAGDTGTHRPATSLDTCRLGWSSPTFVENQIWLTTALDGGKSLRALCLDKKTGKTIHDIEVLKLERPAGIHGKNSHASPTPVIDDQRVFVHFGGHGIDG